jgi:hypothetical protein
VGWGYYFVHSVVGNSAFAPAQWCKDTNNVCHYTVHAQLSFLMSVLLILDRDDTIYSFLTTSTTSVSF